MFIIKSKLVISWNIFNINCFQNRRVFFSILNNKDLYSSFFFLIFLKAILVNLNECE
jgi:hypothetical protein